METNYQSIQDYYTRNHQLLVLAALKGHLSLADAEDIVQDVFVRLLTSKRMINEITLPALAYCTLQNLLRDRWCHLNHVRQHEAHVLHTASRSTDNAASLASIHETEQLLQQGMAMLDERSCKIYRMNLEEGKQVSEIAECLQIKYKTVENWLGAARKKIRHYMAPLCL